MAEATSAQGARPNVGAIIELCLRFQQTAALVAGCRLGVFTHLGAEALTVEALAARLGTPARATGQLVRALAALGLLEQAAEGYRNSPLAARFLDRGSPAYLGDFVEWFGDGFTALAALDDAVRQGGAVGLSSSGAALGALPTPRLEHYVRGMEQVGLGAARYIADRLALGACRRLLDVGGGPAVFACEFARRHPALQVEVLELGPVVPFARARIAREGLGVRVAVREGSYRTDELGTGWDAILLSQVLQTEPPDVCQALLRRLATALAPGGLLIVHGVMADESGIAPPNVVLMSLFFLAEFEGGGEAYRWTDVAAWLQAAGLLVEGFERLPSPALTALLQARKPA